MLNPEKKYLVTGGSGFLGSRLIARLISEGIKNLVVVARDEGKLIALKAKFPELEIITGDIADPVVAQKACHGCDGIFHLAAFKHIGLAENNAWTCIQSNVTGTMNLLKESNATIFDFFVFVSTDKAANMKGVYGASKLIGEKLVTEFAKMNPETKYLSIRFGNIWRSTGSFIEKWQSLMESGKEVVLTDPAATRFFLKAERAVDLIMQNVGAEGLLFPKMKAINMGTVLEACHQVFGPSPVKITGLQEGENMHETIDGKIFSGDVTQFTKDEFIDEFLMSEVL